MKIVKTLCICILSFCLILIIVIFISHNIDKSIEIEQEEVFTK